MGPEAAAISRPKANTPDLWQLLENRPETHGDGVQHTGLAVCIVTVKNGERRVKRQPEPVDGAVVLNLHEFELHETSPDTRSRVGRERCVVAVATP